ncbi:MAG TPA: hypothetical protein VMS22_04995 [Candidatus Eisenbacteria bacterium]|nr:hypothetical protein [Candidatus Eisenbacteria bacterium]
MPRALAAMLLLLGASAPVSAKLLCPPGRFMLHAADARAVALDGRELGECGRWKTGMPTLHPSHPGPCS